MMTGIIPCLYNSYSFTKENIDSGTFLYYDIKDSPNDVPGNLPRTWSHSQLPAQSQSQSQSQRTQTSTLSHTMLQSQTSKDTDTLIFPAVLPEPLFLKKITKSESESESDSDSGSDSDSDYESGSESESECKHSLSEDSDRTPDSVEAVKFHPNDMKQYIYTNNRTSEAHDSILWAMYIMIYGVEQYEMIENHYVESNRFKFELIEILRQNKPIMKANKVKLSVVEETLVHKPFITLETLHAIVLCKSMSLYIVQDRKYYDIESGTSNTGKGPFIIEKNKGKYLLYIAPHAVANNYITYIRANYWRMESISAPIRPISAYKLQDLIDISEKLNLPIVNVFPGKFGSMGTEKRKTKPELYEAICQYV